MQAIAPTFDGRRTVPSAEVTRLMLEMLALKPGEKVMEIGTGSGYQTAALAETGARVYSVELEPWVDATVLTGDCVFLSEGDGRHGLPNEAPFDAVVATCGVEDIPRAWTDQLAPGGRLVAPVGDSAAQRLTLFLKRVDAAGGLVPSRIIAYVRFQMMRSRPVPLPPKYQPKGELYD